MRSFWLQSLETPQIEIGYKSPYLPHNQNQKYSVTQLGGAKLPMQVKLNSKDAFNQEHMVFFTGRKEILVISFRTIEKKKVARGQYCNTA